MPVLTRAPQAGDTPESPRGDTPMPSLTSHSSNISTPTNHDTPPLSPIPPPTRDAVVSTTTGKRTHPESQTARTFSLEFDILLFSCNTL